MKKTMKKNKQVVLDCDDVLLDWSSGFKRYIERETPYRQNVTKDTVFSIGSQYGISTAEGLGYVDKFNTGIYFQMLEACPGARQAVQWLLADDYDIHIITACGTFPQTERMRLRNLDFEFGPGAFKEVIFVPGGHSKVEYLSNFPGCFFVDDAVHNVEAAKMQTDTHPILMENYMNRHLAWDGPRINSLVEFYNIHIAEKSNAA
jgi:5'(3')-deoxyribonucleotidase